VYRVNGDNDLMSLVRKGWEAGRSWVGMWSVTER
jgi:hypothetical protein